jgi:hypothetical protein
MKPVPITPVEDDLLADPSAGVAVSWLIARPGSSRDEWGGDGRGLHDLMLGDAELFAGLRLKAITGKSATTRMVFRIV